MTVSANECLVSRPAPRKRITVAIRSSAPGAKVRGGGKGGKGAGKQVSCLHVDYTNRFTEVVGNPDTERRWTQIKAEISEKCSRADRQVYPRLWCCECVLV